MWNTSLVPIQWAKPHDATKMPQLLCVKLEDPTNFTSQALKLSRAVIHLTQTKNYPESCSKASPRLCSDSMKLARITGTEPRFQEHIFGYTEFKLQD